jgi:hypothetical protein
MAQEGVDYMCRRNVMVPMRDGVKLAADLYLPLNDGTFLSFLPLLLIGKPQTKTKIRLSVNGSACCTLLYCFHPASPCVSLFGEHALILHCAVSLWVC